MVYIFIRIWDQEPISLDIMRVVSFQILTKNLQTIVKVCDYNNTRQYSDKISEIVIILKTYIFHAHHFRCFDADFLETFLLSTLNM